MKKIENQKVLYRITEQKNEAYSPKTVTIHNSKIGLWKGSVLIASANRISQSRSFKNIYEEANAAFQYFIDGYADELPNYCTIA